MSETGECSSGGAQGRVTLGWMKGCLHRHWLRYALGIVAGFNLCGGLSHRCLAQVPEAESVKLFGLPAAKEDAPKAGILGEAFPSELLALGIGSPASQLAENFPNPGDRDGDPAAPQHLAQNLVEKEGDVTRWPYFGHRMSVFCDKGPDGKLVIGSISINGLFDTTQDTPFRKGGRAEAKALISALFAAYGKPEVHRVVEDKKVHLGQVDFDHVVWKRPEGTVFLMFGGSQNSGKLPFLLDIRNPARTLERAESIRPPRWNEKPEAVKADFSKRFDTFCDFVGFDVQKK